jgi:hypothetical protein
MANPLGPKKSFLRSESTALRRTLQWNFNSPRRLRCYTASSMLERRALFNNQVDCRQDSVVCIFAVLQ